MGVCDDLISRQAAIDADMREEREMNFENVECIERSEPKAETAKTILENMDAILKEMSNELRYIEVMTYNKGFLDGYKTAIDYLERMKKG